MCSALRKFWRYVKLKAVKKTFAEFFAGIGLMRMGLKLGGWEVPFANDISLARSREELDCENPSVNSRKCS